jgi:hypothetical protein
MSASPSVEGQSHWVRSSLTVDVLWLSAANIFTEGIQKCRGTSVLVACPHQAVGMGEARRFKGELAIPRVYSGS